MAQPHLAIVRSEETASPVPRAFQPGLQGLAKHLSALCKVSTVANAEPDASVMLALALDVCIETLGADSGSVMLVGNPPSRSLTIAASRGLRVLPESGVPFGSGVAGRVAESLLPLHILGPIDRYPQFRHLRPNPEVAESMVVPLLFRREALGTLSVNATREGTFAPELLSFLVNVADVLAAAISRTRSDRQREHQERLAVLGQLSASMAHELNNPLTFLRANLQALENLFPDGEQPVTLAPSDQAEVGGLVRETLQGVEQMVALVASLKTAARKPTDRLQTVDVSSLLVRAETIVRPQFRHKVVFGLEAAGSPMVSADPSRLLQVLINLLVNAAQAVGPHGHVNLRCRETREAVVLEVQDDGPGIPPEVAGRLFEPFFTTKPDGEGTGLGLSISRQIARDHGGDLTFTTEPGKGTCFRMTLPALGDA